MGAAPDVELNDARADLGVGLTASGTIQAFRLSSGEPAWRNTFPQPCSALAMAEAYVYAICGDRVVSYDKRTGEERVVDRGGPAFELVPIEGAIVIRHGDGTVLVVDAHTNKRVSGRDHR